MKPKHKITKCCIDEEYCPNIKTLLTNDQATEVCKECDRYKKWEINN